MKNYFNSIHAFGFMLSLAFYTSCNGQVKARIPNNNTNEQEITTNALPKMQKKQGTYSYMTHTGPHTDTSVSISSIIEDTKGTIWVSTMGEGVYSYKGGSFINLTVKDGLMTNLVYSMMEDKDGNLWFGTTNGVSRYNGTSFTNFPFSVIKGNSSAIGFETSELNIYTEVWSMLQGSNGKIWLGTTNGVYCYDGKIFTNILESETLTSPLKLDVSGIRAVTDIIEDTEGNIWFTSWSEGLCRFDGKLITSFKKEGLLNNDGLLQDRNGNIWIGGRGSGVFRYNGKTFEKLFTDMAITDMKTDNNGNIWFSRFDRKNNSRSIVLYNPSSAEIISSLTEVDGQMNSYVTSITIDKSGNVWFGSSKMTLSKYDGKIITTFLSE